MAVTSIRSLGSRAMRIEIAREPSLGDDGVLVPCICKTPCWRPRPYIRRRSIPGALVTPELPLRTFDRRKADRDHQIAAVLARWLSIEIGRCKPRLAKVLRYIAK